MATDSADDIAVGKENLSYCTSCRMDLAHIIVSMKGDKIAKVECKTCKKTHVYRAPKGITTPKAKKAKKAKAGETLMTTRSVEAEWERLMTESETSPEKSYSKGAGFGVGDKIKHSTFGQGFVTRLIYPNKMEVIFKSDLRTLVHTAAKA
jgi:hypothetical protein